MASGTKGENQGKSLVVVESPAKARTISRILGDGYVTIASLGHVRDLPQKKLGVKVEEGFSPTYSVAEEKRSVVGQLKKAGKGAREIYLATDPDREGEAISWHIVDEAGWGRGAARPKRVVFHEITRDAVLEAFKHPRDVDMKLVNSQQARRILDRLVGYQISPLLWSRVQRGLSAGRVQSVALRMVVERERDIQGFVPTEWWTIEARLRPEGRTGDGEESFVAVLRSLKGEKGKLSIPDQASAQGIVGELGGADYQVAQVRTRESKQAPAPPFITSTLQQEAWRKLHFSARKTMTLAQQLYEGVALGDEGPVGLITYMRTDSTQLSTQAVAEVRQYIQNKYGQEYLPSRAREYRKKVKGAQEAHEAIRPTSMGREPGELKGYLGRDQLRLYELIWARTVASQMRDALSDVTTVDIDARCSNSGKVYLFRATGTVLRFPGFRAVYMEDVDDSDEEQGKDALPELQRGMALDCLGLETKQHFTQPPPRFTEASLVKALEENGIGRPSTYAPIVSTLLDRSYVTKEDGRLSPTALGTTVCDLLVQHFSNIMETGFTARMEGELDEIARGERDWVPMLKEFYEPFKGLLEQASKVMPKMKVEEPTDEVCPECGRPLVIKTGRYGRFLSCSGFPQCRYRRPLKESKAADEPTDETCEKCGQPMVIKTGRRGKFMACTGFPKCRNTRPLADDQAVEAVEEECEKCGRPMVVKSGRYGKFLACSGYPECRNRKPFPKSKAEEELVGV